MMIRKMMLAKEVRCIRNKEFYTNFATSSQKAYAKPYDILPQDWIKAEMNLDIGNVQRIDRFWCSALVSYIFAKLNILRNTIPWTLIAPNQFSFYENKQLDFKCQIDPEKKVIL